MVGSSKGLRKKIKGKTIYIVCHYQFNPSNEDWQGPLSGQAD